MSNQHEFYLERAAEARSIASAATLDNVRDRWLLSEASWTEMAARSERSLKMRAKLVAEKAAERAALETARQERSAGVSNSDDGGFRPDKRLIRDC